LCVDLFASIHFRIIVCYRPPDCQLLDSEEFFRAISLLTLIYNPSVVVGDFNIDYQILTSSLNVSAGTVLLLNNFLLESSLFCLNNFPTRGNNCLDLVLTNDLSLVQNVFSSENFSTSDHCVLNFSILTVVAPCHFLPKYDFKNCDWQAANLLIASIDWYELFDTFVHFNELYEFFISFLLLVVHRTTPFIKSRSSYASFPSCLQKLAAKKHFLWLDRFKKGGREAFEKISRDFPVRCRKLAASHEKRVLSCGNIKSFFNYINRKIKLRPTINVLCNNEGNLVFDDLSKASLFASYFSSVFSADNGHSVHFASRTNLSLEFVNFDVTTVFQAISKLSDKISSTPESIPSYFLRRTAATVCYPLKLIFERSLACAWLPPSWKTAVVTPILKKGSSTLVSNYRPISLTSSVCKVLEILIRDSLVNFWDSQNIFHSSQYGFLHSRSTLSQLLSCSAEWYSNFNRSIQTEIVYVDYAKAFDSVCHSKLLLKLKSYGISGPLLSWLHAFFTSRNFRVKIGNSFSGSFNIQSGVPQGSILGPLLFLIFINDLPDCINSTCKMFADDVKIYRSLDDPVSDFYELQKDLDQLADWSSKWQLNISGDKCAVLHLKFLHEAFLRINGTILPSASSSLRDLGVYFSSDFSWSSHCKIICAKAMKIVNCILRSLAFKNLLHYRTAFVFYCRPILEYCTQIWAPHEISDIRLIENVQKYFTRIAFRKCIAGPFSPCYVERLKIFNIKSLEYRRAEFDLILCYKIVNGTFAIKFDDIFTWAPIQARRSNTFQLARLSCKSNVVLHSFSYRVVRLWNLLPQRVVSSPCVAVFVKRLRSFDLQSISHFVFS
jgi:hypothetical protein